MFEAERVSGPQGRHKARRVAPCLCAILLLGGLLAAPARVQAVGFPSLALGSNPVEAPVIPTVPVKVPSVPVKVPSVPVKVPSVPVKVPSVPVKVPSVPVKVPSVPVKVPVKAPLAKAPSAPAVPSKTPPSSLPVSGSTPSVGSLTQTHRSPSPPISPVSGGGKAPAVWSLGTGASGASPIFTVGYGPVDYPSSPAGALSSPGQRRQRAMRARTQTLRDLVRHLHGCLGDLPQRLRLALELRAGLDVPRALSPEAVAARLHLSSKQYAALEKGALRRLRSAAKSTGCAGQSAAPLDGSGSRSFGFLGSDPTSAGGVEAVSYLKSASPGHERRPSSSQAGLLGVGLSPAARDALLLTIVIFMAALLIAILFADGLGVGPPHPEWRRAWRTRWRRRRWP
jgi:hypothetical protein